MSGEIHVVAIITPAQGKEKRVSDWVKGSDVELG